MAGSHVSRAGGIGFGEVRASTKKGFGVVGKRALRGGSRIRDLLNPGQGRSSGPKSIAAAVQCASRVKRASEDEAIKFPMRLLGSPLRKAVLMGWVRNWELGAQYLLYL